LEERVGCVDFSGIGESKFLGGFENGKILVWERKHTGERSREEDAYTLRKNVEFIVHDVFDIFQNPHQEEGEKDLPQEESKQQLVPSDLYGFTSNHHTCAKFSKNAPHLYICCVQSLQYIIFRDIQNHTVIILSFFITNRFIRELISFYFQLASILVLMEIFLQLERRSI
jgi:hypothetical protein